MARPGRFELPTSAVSNRQAMLAGMKVSESKWQEPARDASCNTDDIGTARYRIGIGCSGLYTTVTSQSASQFPGLERVFVSRIIAS
jgi:hypothetical protein